MEFSNVAKNYLSKLRRNSDWIVGNSSEITDYLTGQQIPAFDALVDFQMNFSGLNLTVAGKPGSSFEARLFSKKDIDKNERIEIIKNNGRFYFDCGSHKTAQFYFGINDLGQVVTNYYDETPIIIASSFNKWIEIHALEDFLLSSNQFEIPYYCNLIDIKAFEKITEKFTPNVETNDNYNTWLANGELIINKGTWFDRQEFYVHIYATKKSKGEDFFKILLKEKIIR